MLIYFAKFHLKPKLNRIVQMDKRKNKTDLKALRQRDIMKQIEAKEALFQKRADFINKINLLIEKLNSQFKEN